MIQKYRFIAYSPFGAELGQITHPSSWGFSSTYNEISSCKISHRDDMPNASRLQGMVELGVQWSTDGVTWTEPPNGRFLRIQRARVVRGKDKVRSYTMPGMGHLLKKAEQRGTANLNADGKRPFNSANAGTIIKTLFDENKAWGGSCVGLTIDFTTTTDSSGAAWNKVITIAYEPGLDLYTILDNLANQGMCDWYFQGRTLRIFNTSYLDVARPVSLSAGVDVNGIPVEASIDGLVHNAIVYGDAGAKLEINSSYSPPVYWGKWQTSISNGGVSDTGTMNILADQLLHDGSAEKVQYTLEMVVKKSTIEPFRDFVPGNRITAPNEAGDYELFRIPQINVERNAAGKISVSLIANDRFVEAEISRIKRVNGITGGAVAGGSGTRPAPAEPGKRVPATPVGVTLGSTVAINEAGFPRAVATVDWADVTTDVSSVALDIDFYEVQAFLGSSTTPESWGVSAQSVLSRAGLNPGAQWSVQVRAVSATNVRGAWSSPKVTATMQTDTTPPGVPTAPIVTSVLGTATIRWDGKAAGGATMPADLDYVKVWQEGVSAYIDRIEPGGGYTTVGGLTPGTAYQFRLSAIDKSNPGNESAKTAAVSVTIVSAATDAGIQAQLDFLQTEVEQDVGTQITTATNGIAKIIYSPLDPSGTYPTGSTWWKRGSGNLIIGQWEYNGGWVPKTVDSAIIANLDAGKISFGEMDGIRIKAGTIRTGALAVGLGQNQVADPVFGDPTIRANRTANGWTYNSANRTFQSTAANARFSLAAGGPSDAYSDLIQVVPGERWYLSVIALSTSTNTVTFSMQGYDQGGAQNASLSLSSSEVILPNVAETVYAIYTIPAGMYFMNVGVVFATAGTNQVSQPVVNKQTPAVIIQDGAITADKIAVNAVTANAVSAGSIDGMVITGPTIRTAPSGSRVQLDTTGFRVYSGTTLKVWAAGSTGQLRVYATGDLSHTSTGHGFQIGDDDGPNLAFDANEIMSRNAGDYSGILLNREGGNIAMGGKKGGFTSSDVGIFPEDDDHMVQIRAGVEIQNHSYGDYNDLWAPLIVGARGNPHMWMDKISIGTTDGAGGVAILHVLPPVGLDPSRTLIHHTTPVHLGSDSIQIRRIGAAQGGVFCVDAGVALQFINGQVNSRDSAIVGNRSMGGTVFNQLSQRSTKHSIQKIPDGHALSLIKTVKAQKWKFTDETNPYDDMFHYGPMLEDLPEDMHAPVGEKKGYDQGSLVGLLWEALGDLAGQVEALKKGKP